ncbi:MAG: hypothetical protein FAF03_02130 [Epsilonproteobacteria bacterium]|nr:hypothetical protein [Campylobacterota bacterium]
MKRMIKRISVIILLSYVAMGAFLYINQRSYLYFPTADTKTAYHHMTMYNDGDPSMLLS